MVAETTKLVFESRVTGVKTSLAKSAANEWSQGAGGKLELTLSVEQPKAPSAPRKPAPDYRWEDRSTTGKMRPRPGDQTRKKDETDEEYEARDAVQKRRAEQQEWDAAEHHWVAQLAEYHNKVLPAYQAAASAHRERVMAYAQLAGIMAVFGNTLVRVELTPIEQDLLPGFSVSLLAPVAEAEPSLIEEEDSGFEDPDDDDLGDDDE
jgi:hypothetical protein